MNERCLNLESLIYLGKACLLTVCVSCLRCSQEFFEERGDRTVL